MNKEVLSEEIPEKLKGKLILWRKIKDIIEEQERITKPFKDRLKEVAESVQYDLSIEDGDNKSETISVDGGATAWKNRVITLKFSAYSALQKYLTRNNLEFVMRKQLNMQGVQELHRLIMEGEVPMPSSAEFSTFDKITIRKRG